MKKILTLFKRDFDKGGGLTEEYVVKLPDGVVATEKVDGTNVRLTVRNHILVRVEKRRNPTKIEKHKGIKEPWYVDADEYDPNDKWIYEAAKNTDLLEIEDGEWSGEAIGEKIQGNPLNLAGHEVILFSHPKTRNDRLTYTVNPPLGFNELKMWLNKTETVVGHGRPIEGVVWWLSGKPISKIKRKDFR